VTSPGSLALLFLKLGTLTFGGPAAHIAMMRQEVVERKKWLSEAEFLDLLGASNLIPGPSSTELAIHIGYKIFGRRGLLLAGLCFILPAAILVGLLAWIYQTYGALPQLASVMRGVKPVVVAIVLQALRGLAQSSLRTLAMMVIALFAFVLAAVGMHSLLILLLAGASVVMLRVSQPPVGAVMSWLPFFGASAGGTAANFSLLTIFGVFLKIGAVVYGSGYVLLAFLQADLVDKRHWLTSQQLLDAVAVGQVTPGPVFTTATFIGYLLGGVKGALVATAGIFLPGFILVAISGPLIPRIRRSPVAAAFLDGVTVASIALIAWVLVVLGRAVLIDPISIGIAVASLALLIRFRVNAAWLIASGGLLGAFNR
jgi:chromate transporter